MAQIPLFSPGGSMVDTGIRTARTAQLEAGREGAAWGQALGNVAQATMDMAQTYAKAQDAKNLTELSISMSQAQAEFTKFQLENPDETQWLGKWQELQDSVKTQLNDTPLSSDARLRFSEGFAMWSDRGTTNVRRDVMVQSVNNAKLSFDTALRSAQQTKLYAPAYQAVENLKGIVPQAEIESMVSQINSAELLQYKQDYANNMERFQRNGDGIGMRGAAEQALRQGVISESEFRLAEDAALQAENMGFVETIANADPRKAIAQLEAGEFKDLTQDNKDRAMSYAQGKLHNYQTREAAKYADYVVTGGSPKLFRFEWSSPAQQKELIASASMPPMSADEAAASRLELESIIGKYSPANDPDRRQMIQISAKLDAYKKAVPQGSEDLVSTWNKRRSGEPGTKKEIAIADNAKYLNELYKPKLEALMKGSGADKKIKPGKEAEYRRLLAEQSEMQQRYSETLPDDPTPEQAVKASSEILTIPAMKDATRWYENADGLPMGGNGAELNNPLLPTTTW